MHTRDYLMAQTKDELLRLALAEHGEELKPASTKEQLVEQLLEFQGGEGEAPTVTTPTTLPTNLSGTANGLSEEATYQVTIHEESDDPNPFVSLAVNGHALRIKKGEPVLIKERFVHALKNTMQTIYEPVEHEGKLHMREKRVPRFNFLAEKV